MTRAERILALRQALASRVLVLDGAMGTSIQALNLSDEDFGGADLAGCNEHLNLTLPSAIETIHASYLGAGADIIETNTFGGTPLVLSEYGIEDQARDINRAAATNARGAADRFSGDRLRFVAGSMGPTTKAISVTGGVTFEELRASYAIQAQGLHEGGVDYFLIETIQDTRNAKAALLAILDLFERGWEPIPIAFSGTIEPMGTLLAGQSVEAFYASIAHAAPLYVGLNCATGPTFMTDPLRSLHAIASHPLACMPNAGLPDENGQYLETPAMMATTIERFVQEGWVTLIGGCCGTTPAHIEALADIATRHLPRPIERRSVTMLSGIDFLDVTDEKRPILIGERTNVIGSRKFKALVESEAFESAAEIARAQVKNGAHVVDVCLANPDRDEFEDMERFLEKAIRLVRAPLMIDTTDAKVMAMALTYSQGKAILNSINLEDGEDRFEKVVPLARRFGAALVVGTIDEDPVQGMGVTRDRKLAIARRSHELLTGKYGIPEEDLFFDALVFPCATGDAQYVGSAVETIEGVRLLKSAFPRCKTVLGISNVSFGLPTAGRETLNSVFLYHCVQAGLDAAIVNTEMLRRFPSIPPNERTLCEDLLWNRGDDPIAAFNAYFSKKKPAPKIARTELPLDERLSRAIVEGSKEGLTDDLALALRDRKPLEIINGPLMKGMDEVGRLFNQNQLIVAEVLQSAEAMKAAVSFLEPHMEKSQSASRGKVLLATVKGDVHDIGKNLVEIILSNNGFEIVNLGIKVAPEALIEAVRAHDPQIIGLSGLLVKSAQQMVVTAEDLTRAGIRTPMLVGGAALSRGFVDKRVAKAYAGTVEYASDAMNGLELAKILVDDSEHEALIARLQHRRAGLSESAPTAAPSLPKQRSVVQPVEAPPRAPDFDRHVLTNLDLHELWTYINPRMLYGRHLGLLNSAIDDLGASQKGRELRAKVREVQEEAVRTGLLSPRAVYRFFRAHGRGETIDLGNAGSFSFPRQSKDPFLCLSDYVHPDHPDENLCLFAVTAGHGVRETAERWKSEGAYLRSHILSALALETAEALAEWLHEKIRRMWGASEMLSKSDLFKAKYLGRRYSFGYPACPDLALQRILFQALAPEEIGISLTDGDMMDPEASVSAIALHHPSASYFSAP